MANGTIGTIPYANIRRSGLGTGSYEVSFNRADTNLDEIETINWEHPEVTTATGIQPTIFNEYGYKVENITYSHNDKQFRVYIKMDKQYFGDVTGYQEQIAGLQDSVNTAEAEIDNLNAQLQEADEALIAAYEAANGEEGAA